MGVSSSLFVLCLGFLSFLSLVWRDEKLPASAPCSIVEMALTSSASGARPYLLHALTFLPSQCLQRVQWAFNNSVGAYGWRQDMAVPVVKLLRNNTRYIDNLRSVRDVDDVDPFLRELFLSDLGVTKMRGWFKSQKNQAQKHHNKHEQTGASGGKTEKPHVELRQKLYSTNAAVTKDQMRQSRLPLSASDDDGSNDEDGGEDLSWDDVGVSTVVDPLDGGANLMPRLDAEDDYDAETGGGGGGEDAPDFSWEEDEEDSGASWAPPDKRTSLQGLLEEETKQRERKLTLLEILVNQKAGRSSGNADAEKGEITLDQVSRLTELGVIGKKEARKLVLLLAPNVAQILDEPDEDDLDDLPIIWVVSPFSSLLVWGI